MGIIKQQGHIAGAISYWFDFFISHQPNKQFPRYSYFKFDLEKSKVKVKDEVRDQGHIVDPVIKQCISFLFNLIWPTSPKMWPIEFDIEKYMWNFEKNIEIKKIPTEFLQNLIKW